MSRPTIADIARRAKVSKGAVSFALNGHPGVSAATRERILAIAEEMDWRPHSGARALSSSRSGSVGLVMARPARTLGVEPFFTHIMSGIQARLSAEAIALQLMIVEDTAAEIETYRQWAGEQRVDGLILFDLQVRDPRLEVVEKLGLPAIVVGGAGRTGGLSSVWADDREAMLSILEYLARLGHRRISHVAGMPSLQHTRRRARAMRDAAARFEFVGASSLYTDFSDVEGAATTRRLLLSVQERPTAIVYDNDVMAVAGLGVASELGVAVPGEVSIVAFDDSRLTQLTHPALTALSRDTYALGEQVADELLAVLAEPGRVRHRRTTTPVLTERESTAPPPLGGRRARTGSATDQLA